MVAAFERPDRSQGSAKQREGEWGKGMFSPLPFPLGVSVLGHCFHGSCLDNSMQSRAWTKQWHQALVKHLCMLEHLLEAVLFFLSNREHNSCYPQRDERNLQGYRSNIKRVFLPTLKH